MRESTPARSTTFTFLCVRIGSRRLIAVGSLGRGRHRRSRGCNRADQRGRDAGALGPLPQQEIRMHAAFAFDCHSAAVLKLKRVLQQLPRGGGVR
jgi:hypothetical protein